MTEFDKREVELLKQAIDEGIQCVELAIKTFEGEKRETMLALMDQQIKNYCMLEQRLEKKNAIVQAMKKEQEADRSEKHSNSGSFNEVFEEKMKAAMSSVNIKQHKYFINYKKRKESCLRQVDKTDQNVDHEDGDLVITESRELYLDPITKKTIVDPVKSRVCNHHFSRGPIMELLKNKRRIRCPYVACHGVFSSDDLEDDVELAFSLKKLELSARP